MIVYRKGGVNRDGEDETPFLMKGKPEQIKAQVQTFGPGARDKTYFTIFCSVCNTGLCKNIEVGTVSRWRAQNMIKVDPCPRCLDAAKKGKVPEPKPLPLKYRDAMDEHPVA